MMTHHACAAIYVFALLAEAHISQTWWEPLIASGPIGVVLLWFMLRMEKCIRENTAAIITNTLSNTAAILDSKHKDAAIAALAEQIKEQAEKQKQQNEKR